MTSPDLDRYLRDATRGLLGARRRLVHEELHANIVQHALDLQITGLDETSALTRALRDFGPPHRVRGGMLRVHTLPALLTLILIGSGVGTVAYGLTRHDTTAKPTTQAKPTTPPHPPGPARR